MRVFRRISGPIAFALTFCLVAPAWGTGIGEDRGSLLRDTMNRGDHARFSLESGSDISGEIVRVSGQLIGILEYDSANSRFSTNTYDLDEVPDFTLIHRSRGGGVSPITTGLVLGALGAGLGVAFGTESHDSGYSCTTDHSLTSGQLAAILGFSGFVIGLALGAIIAPVEKSEIVMW